MKYFNLLVAVSLIITQNGLAQKVDELEALESMAGLGIMSHEEARKIYEENNRLDPKRQKIETHFKACENVNLITKHEYEVLAKRGKPTEKCITQNNLQALPDSGFLTLNIQERPDAALYGNPKADVLLQNVLTKTAQNISINLQHLRNAKDCFSPNPTIDAQVCKSIKAAVQKTIQENQPEVRLTMALSSGPMPDGKRLTWSEPGRLVNRQLSSSDGIWNRLLNHVRSIPVGTGTTPLTNAEFTKAEAIVKAKLEEIKRNFQVEKAEEVAAIEGRFKGKSTAIKTQVEALKEVYFAEKFAEFRVENQKKQIEALQKAPILSKYGYTSPSAFTENGHAKVLTALDELIENGESELDKVNSFMSITEVGIGAEMGESTQRDPKAADLLGFIHNTPVVEEFLKSNPNYCATAEALVNHSESDENRKVAGVVAFAIGSAVVTGGISSAMGLTAVMSNSMGALLGLGVGGTWAATDAMAASREQKKAASFIGLEDDKAITTFAKAQEKTQNAYLSAATLPLDMIGTGAVTKAGAAALGRTSRSLVVNAWKHSKNLPSNLTSALKTGKGLSPKQLQQSMRQVFSEQFGKKALTDRDLAQVQDAWEILVKKGLVDETADAADASAYMNSRRIISEIIEGNNPEEASQKIVMLKEILSEIDSDAIKKAGKRPEEILDVAAGALELGITDTKQVANVIKNWDGDSLEGLALIYKDAAKKMPPPGKKNLDYALEREKALDKALEKHGIADQAKRRQMIGCSGGGAKAI